MARGWTALLIRPLTTAIALSTGHHRNSAPRALLRLDPADQPPRPPIAIPARLSLDSFFASDECLAFVDLVIGDGGPTEAGHVFWLADPLGRGLGQLDLGGYVAIRGHPFCAGGRCAVAGERRYAREHAEHGWVLGAGGEALDQILSPGDAWEATTVVADGALYDLFLDGGGLDVARWDGNTWVGVGRIADATRFSATADGDGLLVAWAPAGESWRFGRLEGDALRGS